MENLRTNLIFLSSFSKLRNEYGLTTKFACSNVFTIKYKLRKNDKTIIVYNCKLKIRNIQVPGLLYVS